MTVTAKNGMNEMNILLAVDNSQHSQVAIDVVLNRLWPAGSKLKVVCAVERREPIFALMKREEAEAFQNKALDAAKAFTAEVAAKLQERFPDCQVSSEAMFGDSKDVLLKQIEDWPANLIVVGSQGRHGLPRLFLGSVSQTILLHGQCSTLIARYQEAHPSKPSWDNNILVAIDDTAHSKDAFEWVLEMPWPKNVKVRLLSVLPPIADKYSDGISALYKSQYSGTRLEAKQAAQKLLDEYAQRFEAKYGSGTVKTRLMEGDPTDVTLQMASRWPAGLIVLGTRSRGHLTRVFMGSVSQEIVLQAPCPVEVVKRSGVIS